MPTGREKTGIVLGMAISKAIFFPLNAFAEASSFWLQLQREPWAFL